MRKCDACGAAVSESTGYVELNGRPFCCKDPCLDAFGAAIKEIRVKFTGEGGGDARTREG